MRIVDRVGPEVRVVSALGPAVVQRTAGTVRNGRGPVALHELSGEVTRPIVEHDGDRVGAKRGLDLALPRGGDIDAGLEPPGPRQSRGERDSVDLVGLSHEPTPPP